MAHAYFNANDPARGKKIFDNIAQGKYNRFASRFGTDGADEAISTKPPFDDPPPLYLIEDDDDETPDLDDPYADIPPPDEPPDDDDPKSVLEARIEQRLDILRVNAEAKRRLDDEQRPPAVPPPVKNLTALLAEPDTPVHYRIQDIAPENSRIILSAQYKAGKTTLVGNLIRSLVDGDPFLGKFTIHAPARRVVLIDNEMSENTLRRWLRDQNIRATDSVADVISLRGQTAAFNLLDERRRAEWVARLSGLGCDYLIFDCLRPVLDALGLDENRDAGKFLTAYDALLAQANIPDSVIVQHMGHAHERARGDSRLEDWPDAIWRVVRETDEPQSPRYFTAYGRDVNMREGRLGFDAATRRLTYAAGSRTDAKVQAAYIDVIKLLAEIAKSNPTPADARGPNPQCFSKNQIEGELHGAGYGDHTSEGHSQKVVRAAIAEAVKVGTVRSIPGPRRAQLHCITYPCAQCGLPVTSKRERHESCPAEPEGLLE